ncbi:MAG: prolipoprotein diacylglyceryl transferase [Bdellovibrionales bacterium]|nr:prolipoprotein diacylglyceryl transferase [Bdellovibrionales bacterium]
MHPFLKISDELWIPVYLLIISLLFSGSIFWALARARKREMDPHQALNICLAIMLGGFLGARLLHILYEAPSYYWQNPLDVFKVWQGGFVFYGGAVGALLASVFWIRQLHLDFWKWADLFAPLFAFGYGVGRLACFFNGCCYGEVCELPWGVHFPNLGDAESLLRHPTQIYAFLWEMGVFAILMHLEFWSSPRRVSQADPISRWYHRQRSGVLFLLWVLSHSLGRILMESFRDDPRGESLLQLSISTWLSLIFVISALLALKKRSFQGKPADS